MLKLVLWILLLRSGSTDADEVPDQDPGANRLGGMGGDFVIAKLSLQDRKELVTRINLAVLLCV